MPASFAVHLGALGGVAIFAAAETVAQPGLTESEYLMTLLIVFVGGCVTQLATLLSRWDARRRPTKSAPWQRLAGEVFFGGATAMVFSLGWLKYRSGADVLELAIATIFGGWLGLQGLIFVWDGIVTPVLGGVLAGRGGASGGKGGGGGGA